MEARFALRVFGCQMNVYDADRLRTTLFRAGWREADPGTADALIYVTCSIREKAEQKVWSELGRLKGRWSRDGRPVTAVVGCMAQRVGGELMQRYPWVRIVAGPRHLAALPGALERCVHGSGRENHLDGDPRALDDLHTPPLSRGNPYKAYVTIAHGCDNFCSYCIVPYVRGRFQSREPGAILAEMEELTGDGVREITLVGQNVNSYGEDREDGYRFARLLRDAARTPGLRRLRFATNHPKDMNADVVAVMAEEPVVCPALNLPVQSGSDRILRRMRRGYTVAQYGQVVEMLREALPELGLTSDLIVGFPGETEEDFRASMAVLERSRFDLVHTAAFSPRPGTKAAELEETVPEEVKKARMIEAQHLEREIALSISKGYEGVEERVLFDGYAPKGEGLIQGRTPTDKVVLVPGGAELLGRIERVRIERGEQWCLHGRLADRSDGPPAT
ncbi:MAG: tRNA (N6-isopentenyl adenosine(37)-C2)-methylthiotransferase MiaB [Synergistales bacterium]|nr:tRNA (N6-isopentenyl adenosine(37)-C2)-methylthiotransferase MiaB [Synergistales bacterium]